MNKQGHVIHLAVAEQLKRRRLELGMSQRVASEKAGLCLGHYCNLENGKNDMQLSTLMKVLFALNLEMHFKKRKGKRK